MKKIVMWCKKHNIPCTVENIGYNMECARIYTTDEDYIYIANQLYKVSRRNNWKVDSNFYSGVIRVYNYSDYEYLQQQNKNVDQLIDLFYVALREGKTQNEAKEAQYQYAVNNDMLTAFESIYNRY